MFTPPRVPGPTSSRAIRASSPTVLQRITIGTDEEFDKGDIDEEDATRIKTMCEAVGSFLDGADADTKLLHIGVGVGNPPSAWGNPSVLNNQIKRENMSLNQLRPKFIDKMVEADKTVAAIVNFNKDSTADPVNNGKVFTYPVKARFPLSDAGENSRKAIQDIGALRNKATHFSVMNSVSQINYRSLVSLAKVSKRPSLYLKSYAETGVEEGHVIFQVPPGKDQASSKEISFSVDSEENPFSKM
jgi:hypothetical protein